MKTHAQNGTIGDMLTGRAIATSTLYEDANLNFISQRKAKAWERDRLPNLGLHELGELIICRVGEGQHADVLSTLALRYRHDHNLALDTVVEARLETKGEFRGVAEIRHGRFAYRFYARQIFVKRIDLKQ